MQSRDKFVAPTRVGIDSPYSSGYRAALMYSDNPQIPESGYFLSPEDMVDCGYFILERVDGDFELHLNSEKFIRPPEKLRDLEFRLRAYARAQGAEIEYETGSVAADLSPGEFPAGPPNEVVRGSVTTGMQTESDDETVCGITTERLDKEVAGSETMTPRRAAALIAEWIIDNAGMPDNAEQFESDMIDGALTDHDFPAKQFRLMFCLALDDTLSWDLYECAVTARSNFSSGYSSAFRILNDFFDCKSVGDFISRMLGETARRALRVSTAECALDSAVGEICRIAIEGAAACNVAESHAYGTRVDEGNLNQRLRDTVRICDVFMNS